MRVSVTFRIVAGLVLLVFSTMLIACSLKLSPGLGRMQMEERARYCEALAVSSSLFLTQGNTESLQGYLKAVVTHNPDISAAVLRQKDGTIFIQAGKTDDISDKSEADRFNQVRVALLEANQPWGELEIYFPVEQLGLLSIWKLPMTRFIVFVVACCFLGFYLFLRKTLQSLNPSRVIPGRVQEALDTLAGGLLILDHSERIVLANKTIARSLRCAPETLQGQLVSELPWVLPSGRKTEGDYPWTQVLREGTTRKGVTLSLESNSAVADCFVVSCAPVLDDQGRMRGVLVSFEDVTELEKKKSELREMVQALHKSREEIQQKNEELEYLATRDPLTSCLNRRSFYEEMDNMWGEARAQGTPLGCILLDIDHFKSINDHHGHSTGDLVLKGIGGALMEMVDAPGVLCRYGGEEFCILLPNHDIDETARIAEGYRRAVENLEFDELKVTSSFGATAISLGASSAQDLLDEADKCLYAAKRGGRNQVSRWDRVPKDMDFDEPIAREPVPAEQKQEVNDDVVPEQGEVRPPAISRETVLWLVEGTERLAQMIDDQDFAGLAEQALRLGENAAQSGLAELAWEAAQLREAAEKADVVEAIYLTNRLLEQCRDCQLIPLP